MRAHLAALSGVATDGWELLAAHHDPEAVPAMEAPHDPRRPVRVLAGLYVCGDHRDTSTVRGALHSAARAAEAILTDLGVPGIYGGSLPGWCEAWPKGPARAARAGGPRCAPAA
ncbi:hypothetical protein SBADM41S_02581 [Streptomyces badius]